MAIYDRMSDTHGTADEIKAIRLERTKQNKLDHRAENPPARKPIATVAGTKQRMVALREMLLQDGNTQKVLTKVLDMAMDDEHPGQVAALKMCVDRMMPVSMFEDKAGGARTAINISFGRAVPAGVVIEGAVIEGAAIEGAVIDNLENRQ